MTTSRPRSRVEVYDPSMRRSTLVAVAVGVMACSGRTAIDGGESETAATETSETTDVAEPDLPTDPPTACENGVDILAPCSSDTSGFACTETPSPNVGVPMC